MQCRPLALVPGMGLNAYFTASGAATSSAWHAQRPAWLPGAVAPLWIDFRARALLPTHCLGVCAPNVRWRQFNGCAMPPRVFGCSTLWLASWGLAWSPTSESGPYRPRSMQQGGWVYMHCRARRPALPVPSPYPDSMPGMHMNACMPAQAASHGDSTLRCGPCCREALAAVFVEGLIFAALGIAGLRSKASAPGPQCLH